MTNLAGKTVGILGLGQVGGSIASTLKENRSDVRVIAYDIREELLEEARVLNLLDGAADSGADLVDAADIVVIALPVGAIIKTLGELSSGLSSKLLVTDTGSVMSPILATAERVGLANFVSGHPLAGTEKRGSQAWLSTLFVRSSYFITPTEPRNENALAVMRNLVQALGAIPVEVRAVAHDQSFATTSNVAHVLAFLMRRSFERLSDYSEDSAMFACPSYRSATRVAASDPEMVFQMLWYNRQYLSGALRSMASELEIVRAALVAGDPDLFRRELGLK
jgi:prephenate dehydrogenase